MSLDDTISRREFLKIGSAILAGSALGFTLPQEAYASSSPYPDRILSIGDSGKHPVLGVPVNLGDVCDKMCIAVLSAFKGKVYQNFFATPRDLIIKYIDDNNVSAYLDRDPVFNNPCYEQQWHHLCANSGWNINQANQRIETGIYFYNRKEFWEAKKEFTHAVVMNPFNEYGWLKLMVSYNRLKDYRNDVRVTRVAKQFCPNSSILTNESINNEIRNAKRK